MKYFILPLLFFCAATTFAQTDELWEKHQFTSYNGTVLPYRMLPPIDLDENVLEEGDGYSLVIFLHGSGERGDDNQKQLVHVAKAFEDEAVRKDYPAFVIFPQMAANNTWSNGEYNRETHTIDLENQSGNHLAAVMDVIDMMLEKYSVDPDRVYIGGLSMGGFGTWDALSRWPDRFAAAFPVCGAGDPSTVSSMLNVPIWVLHGGADNVVAPECSRIMVAALKEAGASVIYSEFEGVGHNSWDPAFDTRHVIDWIFAQER